MSIKSAPRPLYHYTSADALLGILQSGCLWATDIRFLNDSTEFTFARDLLTTALQDKARRLRNPRVCSLIAQQLEALQERRTVHAYVVSLSEYGNMLSQWRAYAPRDGVSIGFVRSALSSVEDFALHRCVYFSDGSPQSKDEVRKLETIVDEVYESIKWASRLIQQEARKSHASAQSQVDAQSSHGAMVTSALIWAALKIKHKGFAEEAEWRLIDNTSDLNVIHAVGDDPHDRLRFRRGTFGITPYLVAKLPTTIKSMPFGISSITVGPSSNSTNIVASIRELLSIKYNSAAVVESCGIPFRTW